MHHCREKNGGEKTNQPNTKITFRTNEKHNLPLKKSTRKSGVLFLISPYANTPRALVFIYGNLSAHRRFNVCKSHHVCFRHMLVFSYINPPLSIYSNPTIRHFEIPATYAHLYNRPYHQDFIMLRFRRLSETATTHLVQSFSLVRLSPKTIRISYVYPHTL